MHKRCKKVYKNPKKKCSAASFKNFLRWFWCRNSTFFLCASLAFFLLCVWCEVFPQQTCNWLHILSYLQVGGGRQQHFGDWIKQLPFQKPRPAHPPSLYHFHTANGRTRGNSRGGPGRGGSGPGAAGQLGSWRGLAAPQAEPPASVGVIGQALRAAAGDPVVNWTMKLLG